MRVLLVRLLQLFLVLLLVTIFTSYLIDAVPGDVTLTPVAAGGVSSNAIRANS